MKENPMSAERLFTKKTAITLIETMITMLLVGLIFAMGITTTISMMHFFNKEHSKNKAADELSLALEWIEKDAMQADSVDTKTTDGQLVLRVRNYADPARPSAVAVVTYSVSGTKLQRIHSTEGTKTITDILDPDPTKLPVYKSGYSVTPADNLPENYLLVNMCTKDSAGNAAEGKRGIMLRCRADILMDLESYFNP